MLKALGDGETNPAVLAAMADKKLRATQTQLCDALGACTELNAVYRRLLKMTLEELQLLEQQVGQLDQGMASLLSQHQDSVKRVAEMPPGRRLSPADHRRSGCDGSDASFRQAALLLGWCMPWR
jgi:hypothetical protein